MNAMKTVSYTHLDVYKRQLWECENVRRYLIMGPSARFGDPLVADARPLLRNIVETAARVVAGESDLSASLRFGHDTYVVPLLALLRAEGAYALSLIHISLAPGQFRVQLPVRVAPECTLTDSPLCLLYTSRCV